MGKTCTKCNKEKPLSEFHREKNGKYGVRAECKECANQRHSAYDSKEKYRIWAMKHGAEGTVVYWNRRASKVNDRIVKRYGIVEKLNGVELYDKFSSVSACCYCGVSITHNNCHIEHIIPVSVGGENAISNIAFSCGKCNVTKGAKSDKEFFEYIRTVYEHLNRIYGQVEGNTELSLKAIMPQD